RARSMVVPHRRLSFVRERLDLRLGRLPARAARLAGARQRPHLLLATPWRCRDRHLILRSRRSALCGRHGAFLATRSAFTRRPLVRSESGLAPRWYVARADIDASALTPVELQTFCPYKGLCSYYDIGDAPRAGWSYREAYPGVGRISDLVSFEPELVSVQLD